MNKVRKGRRAEQYALDFLLAKGYELFDQNYFLPGGELDLVLKHGSEVVFVEVKSLKNERFIRLEETISQQKLLRLRRACEYWLMHKMAVNPNWRLDFIGLILDNKQAVVKIKHIKNIV